MELLKSFLLRLDPTSIIIGAVVGALISAWFEFFIKQPKLVRNGSGSGVAPGQMKQNSVSFINTVGWLGVNVPESRILGFRIHPSFRRGLTFEKSPARDCRAILLVKDTGESVGQLWWTMGDGRVENRVTIESGAQASLLLFCRKADEESYFVYHPVSHEDRAPRVPDQKAQFTGGREFILRVSYSYDRTYEEVIRIERTYQGLLYLKTKTGSSIF